MTRTTFINSCLKFLGLPYKWGGDDPLNGYDCSGLVQDLLAMVGVDPVGDQTAQALHDALRAKSLTITENLAMLDTGAVVFYGKSITQITHVEMILEERILIGAIGGGSRTLTFSDASAQNAFVKLRPFGYRRDIVSVLLPKGLPWVS